MEKCHIIRHLFQITGDVGGNQNGMLLVLHEFQKQIQQVVPHHRIQSAGRLVQDQQLRVVGKCQHQRKLHAHAAGQFLDLLLGQQGELLQQFLKIGFVPVGIDAAADLPCLFHRQFR